MQVISKMRFCFLIGLNVFFLASSALILNHYSKKIMSTSNFDYNLQTAKQLNEILFESQPLTPSSQKNNNLKSQSPPFKDVNPFGEKQTALIDLLNHFSTSLILLRIDAAEAKSIYYSHNRDFIPWIERRMTKKQYNSETLKELFLPLQNRVFNYSSDDKKQEVSFVPFYIKTVEDSKYLAIYTLSEKNLYTHTNNYFNYSILTLFIILNFAILFLTSFLSKKYH